MGGFRSFADTRANGKVAPKADARNLVAVVQGQR
jgi:hypothetical protein